MAAPLIHICGWPGSGKATIGRLLAARTGGCLIDNHLMLDPASALFERGDPRHAALRAALRREIYAAAQTLPPEVVVIVTDALSDAPEDAALFAPTVDLAAARGAPLRAVTLDIDPEENRRRLTDPARAGRAKLRDPSVLDALRVRHALLRPAGAMHLDVTELSPNDAVGGLLEMLALDTMKVTHA